MRLSQQQNRSERIQLWRADRFQRIAAFYFHTANRVERVVEGKVGVKSAYV